MPKKTPKSGHTDDKPKKPKKPKFFSLQPRQRVLPARQKPIRAKPKK